MTQTLKKMRKVYTHYMDRILYKYYRHKLASQGRKTSISDDNSYPVVCYMASKNERFFQGFRRNSTYNDILEHVSQSQGQAYLDIISQREALPFSDEEWDHFHENDLYGNPVTFPYTINGRALVFSPTTLRYVKVLQDIELLFDTRQIRSIAEIGIGYAGECRIMASYLKNLESYSLFDLPEVLGLAKKYLGKFGKSIIGKTKFVDGTRIEVDESYDFVMSNYAFSELVRDIQDIYLNKVILKSKAGYITWNSLSCDTLDGYSLDALLEKIPGSAIIPEEPLTKEKNCIIVWGTKTQGH